MARIYVDNGININPLWYGCIAVSPDGVNWETISKSTLSVHPVLKGSNTTNPAGVLGNSGAPVQTRIYLRDFTGYKTIDFECNDVFNQPGWNGLTPAALQQAVSDITEWIGEPSTSTTSITGNVGGFTATTSSNIVMSAAGAYATGDYMGTSTTPQSFSGAARTSGGSGIIKSLTISDKIVTANVDMELWLFRATFTAPTDNAAWAISDTEMLDVVGIVPISPAGWSASSNNQVYHDYSLSIPFDLSAGTSLYYALVSRGVTPAFTSLDLTLMLGILQD